MKRALIELLTSKKFLAASAAVLIYVVGRSGLAIDPDTLDRIFAALMVYVGAQGIADVGKGAAVVNAAAKAQLPPVTLGIAPPPPFEGSSTGIPGILILALVVGMTAMTPACAGSTRADTIRGAELALKVAHDGVLVHDGPHELEIAKSGPATPEGVAAATAAMKEYRAKRAIFNTALFAAYDALVVAIMLDDQPSIDRLKSAIAIVLADYRQLKGTAP
jgi:hypothetical protein